MITQKKELGLSKVEMENKKPEETEQKTTHNAQPKERLRTSEAEED